MRTIFKLFCLFVLATVCHWILTTGIHATGWSINMMLAFAIALCTLLKPAYGYPLAFLGGLFLDFFSTKLFGANACTFTLVAFTIYSVEDRFDFNGILLQMGAVFVFTVAAYCMSSLLVRVFTGSILWVGIWRVLGGAAVSALFAPFVFWVVRKTVSDGFMCKLR